MVGALVHCVAFLNYHPYTLYPAILLRCPWEGVCMMDMGKVDSEGWNVGTAKKSFVIILPKGWNVGTAKKTFVKTLENSILSHLSYDI